MDLTQNTTTEKTTNQKQPRPRHPPDRNAPEKGGSEHQPTAGGRHYGGHRAVSDAHRKPKYGTRKETTQHVFLYSSLGKLISKGETEPGLPTHMGTLPYLDVVWGTKAEHWRRTDSAEM